jgi:hypothetical protein
MRANAIERFWALIALVGCFLDEQRAELVSQDGRSLRWGEGCCHLQAQQPLNLLKWLHIQFNQGLSGAELNLYLAA